MSQIVGIPLLNPPKTMAEQLAENPPPEGLWDAVWDVLSTDSSAAAAHAVIAQDMIRPDPAFVCNQELSKRFVDGIPMEQWSGFGGIRSEEQGWALRSQILRKHERRLVVEHSQYPALSVVIARLLDPVTLLVLLGVALLMRRRIAKMAKDSPDQAQSAYRGLAVGSIRGVLAIKSRFADHVDGLVAEAKGTEPPSRA